MSRTKQSHSELVSAPARWGRETAPEDDWQFQPESGSEGMLHLKDLLPRLLARWHWVALGLALGFGFGLVKVWRAVPRYQAKATIQVKDANISTITGQSVTEEIDFGSRNAMATVRETMIRLELAEAVAADEEVRALEGLIPGKKGILAGGKSKKKDGADALQADVPAPPRLAKTMLSWLDVSIRRDTRLIDVTVEHPEPEVAMVIANKFVGLFIEEREDQKKLGSSGSLVVIKQEAERISKGLQETHSLLANYASSIEAEQALAASEEEIATLSLRYREEHPKMLEANSRLLQKRQQLVEALRRAVRNPADREYWMDHVRRLGPPGDTSTMREYRELLEARSAVLTSRIESESSFHKSLLDRKGNQEASKDRMEAEVVRHQNAYLPERPVYPRKHRMLMEATALGLMAGIGLAFLFQYFDNKFHTVSEVEEALELPVFAAVAELAPEEEEPEGKNAAPIGEGSTAAEVRERWSPGLIFREGAENCHHAESFRILRTSLSLLGPADRRKITLITSALPSEGKTFVAANLALALAHQGFKTLLVDFDLRKPSLHRIFGKEQGSQAGIADLLVERAQPNEVLRRDTGHPNLSMILAGVNPPNPGELLSTGRLVECLKLFRDYFDHVVLDSAPVLPIPDTRVLAPLADNCCLVVRATITPRGAVRRALDTLKRSAVTPDGVVFNGYVEKRFLAGKNYSYGQYKYGKYGSKPYGGVYGQEEQP